MIPGLCGQDIQVCRLDKPPSLKATELKPVQHHPLQVKHRLASSGRYEVADHNNLGPGQGDRVETRAAGRSHHRRSSTAANGVARKTFRQRSPAILQPRPRHRPCARRCSVSKASVSNPCSRMQNVGVPGPGRPGSRVSWVSRCGISTHLVRRFACND